MLRKAAFWLLWISFLLYAFLLAPPNQPDTFDLIVNLSTGQWDGINPLVIALFNLLGVFPLIYSCLMLIDGKMQRIPASLFVAASFGSGAFAILPYLALRQPNQDFVGPKSGLLKVLDSRWTGVAIALTTLALVSFGLAAGNWADFVAQWQTSRFIHVMTLDFGLLCLLFPTLLGDDMARRGLHRPGLFWAVSLVPLLGAAAYLVLRPPLEAEAIPGEAIQAS